MVPWLFIGGGTVIAMAMGVSTLMSDHQNYVRPLVIAFSWIIFSGLLQLHNAQSARTRGHPPTTTLVSSSIVICKSYIAR
jgi:hypothetical protein